jgi:Amt family ammonium transporter
LLFGNPHQLLVQAEAVVAAWVFSAVLTFIILKAVGLLTPLRASEDDEEVGLDLSQHGEVAYQYADFAGEAHSA